MGNSMKLMKATGKKSIHVVKSLPPFENEYVVCTGRKGPLCDANLGYIYMAEIWDGTASEVTCEKCKRLLP